jgi:peptide/nickel transport system ATP-binding protein
VTVLDRDQDEGLRQASGSAPLLSVRGLTIEFADRRLSVTAVEDVSFDVFPGEVLGLVGESGAGKSVTGNALIGLLDPPGRIAAGEILFEGQRLGSQEEARRIRGRRIGAIFQDPLSSLNPLFTVGQQLVETIRTHLGLGQEEARRRAIHWLKEVGIPAADRRIDQYPHQFSGGMRQRVVIALALWSEPRLIIADEPTTSLDVSTQAQILALMRRLAAELGTAIILVTHDMGVIAEMADRVAVMYAGRIVEIGRVREVILSPRHPYTLGLMRSIPSMTQRVRRLPQIDGAMPRLGEWPPGCPFHLRCAQRLPHCDSRNPPLVAHRGRMLACWLYPGDC